jgi:hypothetical protein
MTYNALTDLYNLWIAAATAHKNSLRLSDGSLATASNNGDISASLLMSLLAGDHLTANS